MFDEARHTLKEAMALSISRYGDESESVAHCHSRMSNLCDQQAAAIKNNMTPDWTPFNTCSISRMSDIWQSLPARRTRGPA